MKGRPALTGARERKAAARHRVWVRTAIIGAVVAVVAAGIYLIAFSPVFALKADKITVAGTGTVVNEASVREVVDTQRGVPLAKVDTQKLGEELVTIAGVRSATLTRTWPDGLHVDIEAREPVAQVDRGDHWVLVDREGVEVGSADQTAAGLPVLTLADTSGNSRTVKAVLSVINELPGQLRSQVATIGADTPSSVSFTLTDGRSVRWGEAGDAQLKSRALDILLAQVQAHEFDVSAPLTPITR